MKENTSQTNQVRAYQPPRLDFDYPLSFGTLDIIAPVDEVEVKEFNQEYQELLNLL